MIKLTCCRPQLNQAPPETLDFSNESSGVPNVFNINSNFINQEIKAAFFLTSILQIALQSFVDRSRSELRVGRNFEFLEAKINSSARHWSEEVKSEQMIYLQR